MSDDVMIERLRHLHRLYAMQESMEKSLGLLRRWIEREENSLKQAETEARTLLSQGSEVSK